MRHSFLVAGSLLACASTLTHAHTFNAKTMALSDAGIATSKYLEGMDLNPAAMANFEQNDDFNLRFNLGAFGTAPGNAIDDGQDLLDTLDEVNHGLVSRDTAQTLLDQLQAVDGDFALIDGGAGVYLNIPTNLVSVGLYGKTDLSVGVAVDVADSDLAQLQAAVDGAGLVDADDLGSSSSAMGAAVTEFGMNLARSRGALSYGVTLKYQNVQTIDYVATLAEFDEDDFDADEYTTEDSAFNADVGVQAAFGEWRLGATLENVLKHEYESVAGRTVKIEPRLTVGGGYRNGWLTGALDVDAIPAANLVTGEDSRFARAGVEINAWNWAQLRLGYQSDLDSVLSDTASVGLGLSPFGVINLDIAAVVGEDDTTGVALQLGASF